LNIEPSTSKHRYQNHVAVGVVMLFVGVAMAAVQYKVPTILVAVQESFGMDNDLGSWLMSIFTLMTVFFAIPAGALSQKYSPRLLIGMAGILAIAGSLLGAFADLAPVLIVSRAIEGVALCVTTTCGPVVVQKCVRPTKIGTAMGIFGIWGCVGSVVAMLLTPQLYVSQGYVFTWVFFAIVVLVAVVVMFLYIRIPNRSMRGAEPSRFADRKLVASDSHTVVMPARPRYLELFTRDIGLFFAAFLIVNLIFLAVLGYVPTILQLQGMEASFSGFVTTLPMMCSVIISPLCGIISDRFGHSKVLLAVTMLGQAAGAFLLYTSTGVLLWLGAALLGLLGTGAMGLVLTVFIRLLPRPELATIGMGVFATVQGLGQFLGTFLISLLLGADLSNTMLAGIVIVALGVIGSACSLAIRLKS
jgi:MFS family permease